jgi:hypothetical protein
MTGARRDPRVLRRRLAECVTVVAAAAALATAIDDTATRIVIAAVAVVLVGLVALLTEREALAGDAEELRLRLRDGVPIARLRDLDPHRLGVDPEVIGGWAYVDRAVDASLRTALRDALNVSGPSLIAVRGPSKAGKSRTLYEAARHEAADAWVVAPRDAEAFADLLKLDGLPRLEAGPAVVWLDDLEPFVRAGAHGLTPAASNGWAAGTGLCWCWQRPEARACSVSTPALAVVWRTPCRRCSAPPRRRWSSTASCVRRSRAPPRPPATTPVSSTR